jgi:hypothetical protein
LNHSFRPQEDPMPETTTLNAPATAAWKTPVEPLVEPVRLGRYDLPHCMVMASLTRSRAPQPAMFLQDYGGAAERHHHGRENSEEVGSATSVDRRPPRKAANYHNRSAA